MAKIDLNQIFLRINSFAFFGSVLHYVWSIMY